MRFVVAILLIPVSLVVQAQEPNRSVLFPKTGEPWCVVDDVINGGQAEKLGIKSLDIIITINGKEVHDRVTMSDLLDSCKDAGIDIEVLRDGRKISVRGHLEGNRLGVYTSFAGKEKFLTPREMKADLDLLFSSLVEVHPNVYANLPKDGFEGEKQKAYRQATKKLPAIEFWKLAASFVAKIGDGHTGVEMPAGEWNLRRYAGEKLMFPLIPFVTRNGVYVRRNLSSAPIRQGDLITAINGVPIESILQEYERYTSGEIRNFRLSQTESRFPQMLFYLSRFVGPFVVEIKNGQGSSRQFTVKGVDKWTYDEGLAEARDREFHFDEIPQLRTGILRFNGFIDRDRFAAFLNESFSVMKEKQYEYLVIDLQNNGGGDSRIAATLIEHITDRPYRFFGGTHMKIHSSVAKYFPEDRIGQVKKYDSISLRAPEKNDLRFRGKVYVLISYPTFSTASGFAAVIKDFNLGTLVGEETGGLPTCFGDVHSVLLPNSRLSLVISWKYFIRPSGNTEYLLQGVMPDVPVPTTGRDLLLGLNPAMEKVKELVGDDLKKKKL